MSATWTCAGERVIRENQELMNTSDLQLPYKLFLDSEYCNVAHVALFSVPITSWSYCFTKLETLMRSVVRGFDESLVCGNSSQRTRWCRVDVTVLEGRRPAPHTRCGAPRCTRRRSTIQR